ncbi:MAG: hypothetical protein OJF49_003759 [Ktedonobacterales bacterium]|jgi:hypothetical protein|nr:MAG: hypothetical protein OJF49_003759 [Ktedonobacterales bacterium]
MFSRHHLAREYSGYFRHDGQGGRSYLVLAGFFRLAGERYANAVFCAFFDLVLRRD